MRSPLAFDDDGQPIDLPASSRLWRVKQASGKAGGRPRFVRTEGGQPLTLPLDATFHDLRAEGCAPGAYRLEAIDQDGQPAGFELPIDLTPAAGSPETDTAANKADVIVKAFDSLTGAIEQMQKVQLEREKTQGAIFIALIERLGVSPAAATKPPNVLDTLKQLADAQKLFNKTAKELAPEATPEATPEAQGDEAPPGWMLPFIPTIQEVSAILGTSLTQKLISTTKKAEGPGPTAEQPTAEQRFALIREHFTEDEQGRIDVARGMLGPAARRQFEQHLLSVPITQAVTLLQQLLLGKPQPTNTNGTNANGANANEAHAG